jgi:hypothetical protein
MADEPETDAPMTARERRRSRAQSSKPKGQGGRTVWQRYKVHVIIVLIFGGLAAAMAVNASQTKECPGHWHSTMDVYVNGQRVSFNHQKYDLNGASRNGGSMSLAMHMHQPDDALWHWEPQGGADCAELRDALEHVDMELTSSRLVLDGAHEQLGLSGTFTENETHKLSAWHRIGDGEWEEMGINALLGRQPQPDERQLIVFGNQTEEQMAPFRAKADANNLQGSSGSQGGASYVPVVGVSIMGLVALGVWHSLSRKM